MASSSEGRSGNELLLMTGPIGDDERAWEEVYIRAYPGCSPTAGAAWPTTMKPMMWSPRSWPGRSPADTATNRVNRASTVGCSASATTSCGNGGASRSERIGGRTSVRRWFQWPMTAPRSGAPPRGTPSSGRGLRSVGSRGARSARAAGHVLPRRRAGRQAARKAAGCGTNGPGPGACSVADLPGGGDVNDDELLGALGDALQPPDRPVPAAGLAAVRAQAAAAAAAGSAVVAASRATTPAVPPPGGRCRRSIAAAVGGVWVGPAVIAATSDDGDGGGGQECGAAHAAGRVLGGPHRGHGGQPDHRPRLGHGTAAGCDCLRRPGLRRHVRDGRRPGVGGRLPFRRVRWSAAQRDFAANAVTDIAIANEATARSSCEDAPPKRWPDGYPISQQGPRSSLGR